MDIRILLSKFNLLSGEGRDRECADVGWELLVFLFRSCYNRPNLLGECMLCCNISIFLFSSTELFNTGAKKVRSKLRAIIDKEQSARGQSVAPVSS